MQAYNQGYTQGPPRGQPPRQRPLDDIYNQGPPRGQPPNSRPMDPGSVRQARERAEAGMRQGLPYDRSRPMQPRYPTPNGRSITPEVGMRQGPPYDRSRPIETRYDPPYNGRSNAPEFITRAGYLPNGRSKTPEISMKPGPPNNRSRPGESRHGLPQSGRSNIPIPTSRSAQNAPPNSRNPYPMQPPPAVWRTAAYGSANNLLASSQEDLTRGESRSDSRGELEQDFRFPQAPKSITSSPRRIQGVASPNPQHMQQSQSGPGSPGRLLAKAVKGLPASPRPEQAPFRDSPTMRRKPDDTQSLQSELSSRVSSPEPEIGIVRQASIGQKGRPAIKQVSSWGSSQHRDIATGRVSPITAMTARASPITAISAAIVAGMGTPTSESPKTPQTPPSLRMPFGEKGTASPTSVYTSRGSALEPPRVFQKRSVIATPQSSTSANSTNRLLGSGLKSSMSDKIPSDRRPPRLNIDLIKEAQARGSTTSLSELIRRATKLASNLDRGKTASRMGMLDMFNSERGPHEKRKSGDISDILSSFPPPGSSPSSSRHGSRQGNAPAWGSAVEPSGLRAGYVPSAHSQSEKARGRRYLGMSRTSFFVVLFVVIILLVAAVLVPVFLVVLPNQGSSHSLAHCSTSHACQNMGISVVSNNVCGCICVNGYSGSSCTSTLESDCTTTEFTVGSTQYADASAGSEIPAILSGSESNFNIPLNSTALLALFSANNMTCFSQNSIVTFNNVLSQNTKRFFPFPEFEDFTGDDLSLGGLVAAGVRPDMPASTQPPPLPTIYARDPQHDRQVASTVGSSNGIVFQASTTTALTEEATATAISSTTSSSSPSPSASSSLLPVSAQTINFAQVVVLYVFEQSRAIHTASNAQQIMQSYLQAVGGAANGTLQIGSAAEGFDISADFKNLEVVFGNGTTVGGKG